MFDKQETFIYFLPYCAEVVELVDTRDLKSLGLIARTGSSPVLGIFYFIRELYTKGPRKRFGDS